MENQIIETTTETVDGGSLEVTPDLTSANPASGQQPPNAGTAEVSDWTKDDRAKRMWWNNQTKTFDPNLMFKSVRSADELIKTKYHPLKERHDKLDAILKEHGFEFDGLGDVFKEYKTLKDPNNPHTVRSNYLQGWLDDEIDKPKVVSFFQQLENEKLQRMYPNMNAEQIKKMQELENKTKSLEQRFQKQEEEKAYAVSSENVANGIKQSAEYAAKVGLQFTDEIKNRVLDYCDANGIPTSQVFATFLQLNLPALEKAYAEKAQNDQLKALNKNKNAVIPAAGENKAAPPTKTNSLRETLKSFVIGDKQ